MSWEDRSLDNNIKFSHSKLKKDQLLKEVEALSSTSNFKLRELSNQNESLKIDILRLTREITESNEKIERQKQELHNINGVIRFLGKLRAKKNQLINKVWKIKNQ